MFRLFEQSTQSFWRRGNSTFLRLSLFFVYSLFVLFYFPTQKNIELRLCLITAGCNPRTFCRRKRISYIVFLLIFLVKLNEAKTNYCTERFILRRSCYNFFLKFTLFVSPFFNNFKQVITSSNENSSGNCL